MQGTRVLMMARKTWPVTPQPPVAHSRRQELMLAFRPSPEIPGFNVHYLAAARWWIKDKKTQQEDIGHIRKGSALTKQEIEEAKKRVDNLPQTLKDDMAALWKDTSLKKKDGGLWVREEIKRSKFGGNVCINEYWATTIRLARQFLKEGPSNLMKLMEEGGFLAPDKDHDKKEFAAYMERRLGKRIYPTFEYSKVLRSDTLKGVYVLFDHTSEDLINHPNVIQEGKFRVGCSNIGDDGAGGGGGKSCSTGGVSGGSFESGGGSGGSFESGGRGEGCSTGGGEN